VKLYTQVTKFCNIFYRSIGRQQKSLAEREAAYAEARLRIFGSVKENDDEQRY
jgi:hypothetical protein